MVVKLLIFTALIFGSCVYGENADLQPNPLATVTEMMVRFFPSMQITEFTCTTRYNVSKSQKLVLLYNGVEKYHVTDVNQLNYADEDAQPGEYKCKVGNDEAVFNLDQSVTTLDVEIVELAFHANLVTEQVQIEYETVNPEHAFSCYEDDVEMLEAYHYFIAGVEIQGFNGTAEPKIKTNYKCYVSHNLFQFSFTNKVEDLYPRINKFRVQITPSSQGPLLNIFCQSRTVQKPKIMLFVNQFQLKFNKLTNTASYTVKYTDETAFKCIVENKYGRDIISWGSKKIFTDVMDQGDAFSYNVDPNKQITEMRYRAANAENMDRIKFDVKEKNQAFQYQSLPQNNKEKIFIDAYDKFVVYKCHFKKGEDFNTAVYAKDWLQPPKFDSVIFKNEPGSWSNEKELLYISCRESIKIDDSLYAINLFNGETKLGSIQYLWTGAGRGLADNYRVSDVKSAKCVIENDVGFDEFTMYFKNKIPKYSKLEFSAGFPPDGTIKSTFDYNRENNWLSETTNCRQNGGQLEPKTSIRIENKEQQGEFACVSEAWVNCMFGRDSPNCRFENSSMAISWSRKSYNFIPDGSLKVASQKDKFSSYFGFYEEPSS